MCYKYWIFILLPVSYCHALIVPQELPSILSLIFSTIPQVKKGTDSRLGFGFRLGEHADVQVMLELGPQKETRPIGSDGSTQNSKRHVNQDDYDQDDTINIDVVKNKTKSITTTNKEAANWLKNWSNGMRSKRKKIIPTPPANVFSAAAMKNNNNNNDNNFNENEKNIKVVPLISETALKQLQILYGQNSTIDSEVVNESQQQQQENLTQDIIEKENLIKKNKEKITAELSDVTLD